MGCAWSAIEIIQGIPTDSVVLTRNIAMNAASTEAGYLLHRGTGLSVTAESLACLT